MRQVLTQKHLNQGLEKLEDLLWDEIHKMSVFSTEQGMVAQYSCNQRPIITCRINPQNNDDILAFLRRVYIHIKSQENDQAIISSLEGVAYYIENWVLNPGEFWRYKKGRIPVYYECAYDFIKEVFPDICTLNRQEIPNTKRSLLHKLLRSIIGLKQGLIQGEAILIRGIQEVYELGRKTSLREQLHYIGDKYCTSALQTYGFRRDLERLSK